MVAKPAGIDLEWNYVTVTLCVCGCETCIQWSGNWSLHNQLSRCMLVRRKQCWMHHYRSGFWQTAAEDTQSSCPTAAPQSYRTIQRATSTEIRQRLLGTDMKSFVTKKGSPRSITECRIPVLIPVLGSQPAGDVSHKPGSRLPLGPQLPLQPLKGLLPISLLGEQRHDECKQFA